MGGGGTVILGLYLVFVKPIFLGLGGGGARGDGYHGDLACVLIYKITRIIICKKSNFQISLLNWVRDSSHAAVCFSI